MNRTGVYVATLIPADGADCYPSKVRTTVHLSLTGGYRDLAEWVHEFTEHDWDSWAEEHDCPEMAHASNLAHRDYLRAAVEAGKIKHFDLEWCEVYA